MNMRLTAGQRARLGEVLGVRQRALQQQLRVHHEGLSRVEHAEQLLQQDGDDAPQRAADREVDQALSDLDVREAAAIADALRRLQTDSYGLCVDCGAAIPFDRLLVEPHALRCVPCEAARERPGTP